MSLGISPIAGLGPPVYVHVPYRPGRNTCVYFGGSPETDLRRSPHPVEGLGTEKIAGTLSGLEVGWPIGYRKGNCSLAVRVFR